MKKKIKKYFLNPIMNLLIQENLQIDDIIVMNINNEKVELKRIK
jgi:hypothetical protein